jgi:hypothetical protein
VRQNDQQQLQGFPAKTGEFFQAMCGNPVVCFECCFMYRSYSQQKSFFSLVHILAKNEKNT